MSSPEFKRILSVAKGPVGGRHGGEETELPLQDKLVAKLQPERNSHVPVITITTSPARMTQHFRGGRPAL